MVLDQQENKKKEYYRRYRMEHREELRRNTREYMRRKRGIKNHGYILFNEITHETKKVRTINEGAAFIGCCFLTFRKLIDSDYSWNNWIGERAL